MNHSITMMAAPVPATTRGATEVAAGPSPSVRTTYLSPEILANQAVGDAEAALDQLLDMLADPSTEPSVRAVIREWLNG